LNVCFGALGLGVLNLLLLVGFHYLLYESSIPESTAQPSSADRRLLIDRNLSAMESEDRTPIVIRRIYDRYDDDVPVCIRKLEPRTNPIKQLMRELD
jgi:hypothetical protein